MMEARIECKIREYPIADLGLMLRRGQIEWVDATKAKGSKELTHAVRIGAVSVRYEERFKVAKHPDPPPRRAPPSVGMSRPRRKTAPKASPPAQPVVDTEAIAKRAEEAARKAAREEGAATRAELARLRQAIEQGSSTGSINQGQLEAALKNVLGGLNISTAGAPSSGPAAAAPSGPEEPVFIPDNIVDKDAKADIKVESKASEGDGLDDAAAALRKKRGTSTRKRTPRKKSTAKTTAKKAEE
jgi:hypothetical protein